MSVTQIKYIVFTGPRQAGKTRAAKYLGDALTKKAGVKYETFSFAVLAYAEYLLDVPAFDLDLDTPLPEMGDKTIREFILREQQHMRFNYGPRVLGTLLRVRTTRHHMPTYCIVDDGDNVNDVNGLENFILIDITRKSVERAFPFVVPGADYYIRNDGTLEELQTKMTQLAEKV